MKKKVPITYRDGKTSETIDFPNHCPHCGSIISPHVYEGYSEFSHGNSKRYIGILVQCTARDCGNFFAVEYKGNSSQFELLNYSYRPPIDVDFPKNIEKISEKFVEIYSQATKAESEKLDQIAGVGYRKALEFLIKDYAAHHNEEEKNSIEESALGVVINKYLDDFPKLQHLARASTWIGNDETHYVRRHEQKDINDMKAFILSAAQFIAADYEADLALNFCF